jgi:hypothetical protein
MNTTNKLIAAAALLAAFAAPVFSAQANVDGETLQLLERNTYANPPAGWTANAKDTTKMASKHHGAMQMQAPAWRSNVSPASLNSGLDQQR